MIIPCVIDRFDTIISELIILYIVMLVLVCIHSPIVIFWEGIHVRIYLCVYSEFPVSELLYYHIYWADMTHHKP